MGDSPRRTLRFGTVLTLFVIGVTGALQHSGASASTASPDPISFDEAAVTVDRDVDKGVAVVSFVNQTGVPLTVAGKLAGIGDPVASDPNPVPTGETATITVAIDDLEALSDDARLVVTVAPTSGQPDGWVARLPFVDDDAKSSAQPTVDTWRTISFSAVPPRLDDTRDTEVPLKNTGSCDAVDLRDATPVGWLQAEGQAVRVTASCKQIADGSLVAVLDVEPAGATGRDYEGTIDLAPDDEENGTVDLTSRRTMQPVTFGLLLALGILLAVVIRWWTLSGKAVAEQLSRIADLRRSVTGARPDNPLEQFGKTMREAGLTEVLKWNLGTSVNTELQAVEDELRALAPPWRPNGASTKSYKSATKRVDTVEGVLTSWPALAKSLVRLNELTPKLASLPKVEQSVLTATLRRPTALIGVNDVAAISTAVEHGIELAEAWPHDRFESTRTRFEHLHGMTDDDHTEFATAKAEAEAAWAEFEAKRTDATDDDDQLEEVNARLYEALRKAEYAIRLHEAHDRNIFMSDVAVATPSPSGSRPLTEQRGQSQGTSIKLVRAMQWTFDRLALAAVLLVAIVAGTKALYVDQAIGGWWDMLVIVTWGFAAATVAEPIASAIQSVSNGLSRESAPDQSA